MNHVSKNAVMAFGAILLLTGTIKAQQTTTYTNRRGDTVTDTTNYQNGQYTNDKAVTAPNGKTHTNDYTSSVNSNGHLVTSDTRTGPNGRSATSTTTHGWRGNKTTVTGPNGNSRTY